MGDFNELTHKDTRLNAGFVGVKFVLPIVIVAIALAGMLLLIQSRPEAALSPPPAPSVLVSVQALASQPVNFRVQNQGSVVARTYTMLISEVAGQVRSVAPVFVVGGKFRRGDLLVQIDPRNYETNLKRASANVTKAQTQVAVENALAGYALEDWERLRDLSVAKKQASDLALRKPQLTEALAELESMLAEVERARRDLSRTTIRAPYDGMVSEKIADVGQYVNVGGGIARTFAIDVAEVRLPLTQRDLSFLDIEALESAAGLPVRLTAEIGGEQQSWEALVVRSEGVFDATSRVLYVIAQVDDPYNIKGSHADILRLGTFVSAEIQGRPGGNLFVVPRHAVAADNSVWIVDADNRLQSRAVNVLRFDERAAYLEGDIRDGELLCITPIDQPLPGMSVRLSGGAQDARTQADRFDG